MKTLKKAKGFKIQSSATSWYETVSHLTGPKFITGLRGIGKGAWLKRIATLLIQRGLSAERQLFIDTADSQWRRFLTGEEMLDFIQQTLPPSSGKSYVFIREAAALPDAAVVIGALVATSRFEIIATSSSRRLLTEGLSGYLAGKCNHIELLPPSTGKAEPVVTARARWNEIFLYDVLAPNRIIDTFLVNRTAGWLSDHLGEATSLRIVSKAISPTQRVLSPHTIEAYLAALEDSHLVEKVPRYDHDSGSISARNYRYYFTDPDLRLAHFGPAPTGEKRRMALNRAWLTLRRNHKKVYCSENSRIDFVTDDGGKLAAWHVEADAGLTEMAWA